VPGFSDEDAAALDAAAAHAKAYRAGAGGRPVNAALGYPEALARFAEPTPEAGLPGAVVVGELVRRAEGGLLGTVSPNFHGWVIGASHPVGVAADWLAAAWGQAPGFADIAPAAAAAEEVAARWLLDMLGLPAEAGVGFATGATMANFAALAAARTALLERAGWDVEARGLFGAPEVGIVLGGEAHSSVYLTLRMLGFGAERVHVAEADAEGRMRPEALERVLARLAGPTVVCLQAGNVNSGAFDPFEALVPVARGRGAWVHVDGAFGLWAAAAPGTRYLTAGAAAADSWAADAHKWLQVPYDCGLVVVRDAAAARRAMGSRAGYLPQEEERRNPSDFVPELSRRARGLAVWAVIKALGRSGVAEMVERHCAVARAIAARLAREPGLRVLNEVVLNQVVVACGADGDPDGDALTRATLAAVQAGGVCYPSAGHWRGRAVIRVSVSAGPATLEDGARTAEAIAAAWRGVRAKAA
jgi:glutamate/tyrosine decarboxylase-like PLP-dependent enzyme